MYFVPFSSDCVLGIVPWKAYRPGIVSRDVAGVVLGVCLEIAGSLVLRLFGAIIREQQAIKRVGAVLAICGDTVVVAESAMLRSARRVPR